MLAFWILAFGVGAALAAYELSPKARSRMEAYAHALEAVHNNHGETDAHLTLAGTAMGTAAVTRATHAVKAGIDHALKALTSNQEAAKKTAELAQGARTEVEQAVATASAARVLDREQKIFTALASLGVGKCGLRSYPHVTQQIVDTLLAKLHAEGMAVTGSNPWDIETHQGDVNLRAVWDEKKQTLWLIVSGWGALASFAGCDVVWGKLDPKIAEVLK